ncbi:Arc family DNA-binding protein [Castellaniella sp. UC4442_H9]
MKRETAIVPKWADKGTYRFPPGVRERLKEEATKRGRSVNTELVERVVRSLDKTDESEISELREYIREEFEDLRREISKLRELVVMKR